MRFNRRKIQAKNIDELVEYICNLYERHTGIRWRVLKNSDYFNRGIFLDDKWKGASGRREFVKWSLVHGFKPELVIDRINTKGHYSPSNCRWIKKEDNSRNCTNSIMVKFRGKIIGLAMLARTKHCKISYSLLKSRIFYKWPIELALKCPPNKGLKRSKRRLK